MDFNGLGGSLIDMTPATVVPEALAQPGGGSLRTAEDVILQSGSAFGEELARLRVFDYSPVVVSKLRLDHWLHELSQSETPTQAAHLYWALRSGIRFLPRGHRRRPSRSPNYFDEGHRTVVYSEFERLDRRGFTRPADHIEAVDILAVGCIVKTDKVRCVVNASAPVGRSINDDIDIAGVTFPRLLEAASAMHRGDFIWKADVGDYYLNFPLRPDQYPHVIVEINGKINVHYAFLCFGIRNAVRLAQGISVLITEMLRRRLHSAGVVDSTIHAIHAYLDDWCGIHCGQDGGRGARLGLTNWMTLMNHLGLPYDVWKPGKIQLPCSRSPGVLYLGVYLDPVLLRLSLDAGRVSRTRAALEAFLAVDTVSLLDVQQLHGMLSFTCVALPVGTHLLFHLRRLMAAGAIKLPKAASGLRLHPALRDDLRIFALVLQLFNGREISAASFRRHLPFDFITDASVYGGCAFFGGTADNYAWDDVHESADMCLLEARVVRIALEKWGRCWVGMVVHHVGDNQGVRDLLQGGTVRRSVELQTELVHIVALLLKYDIVIVPHLIPTLEMERTGICDAGSRCAHPDVAEATKYSARFRDQLASWHEAHPDEWQWRRSKLVPRPDADFLGPRWRELNRPLPLPQVQPGKRKSLAM